MVKLHKIFVYGTLKKGEPNHYWFSKEKDSYYKFICDAQTLEQYPLIIATKYNIPFLLHQPGVGNYVKGEVFEVDDQVLANLDILEQHPSFYIREEYTVKCITEENSIKAWIYMIKTFKPDLLINKTLFASYKSKGRHGLKYVTKSERTDHYNYVSDILLK